MDIKADLKILRVADQGGAFTVILKNVLSEDELPYVFWIGDRVQITEDGSIKTIRRDPGFPMNKEITPEWLESRLKELHWKIQHCLKQDGFVSMSDVYERNYLLEIYKLAFKKKE